MTKATFERLWKQCLGGLGRINALCVLIITNPKTGDTTSFSSHDPNAFWEALTDFENSPGGGMLPPYDCRHWEVGFRRFSPAVHGYGKFEPVFKAERTHKGSRREDYSASM